MSARTDTDALLLSDAEVDELQLAAARLSLLVKQLASDADQARKFAEASLCADAGHVVAAYAAAGLEPSTFGPRDGSRRGFCVGFDAGRFSLVISLEEAASSAAPDEDAADNA